MTPEQAAQAASERIGSDTAKGILIIMNPKPTDAALQAAEFIMEKEADNE